MRRKRPTIVLVLGILHLVGGGLGLVCGVCLGANQALQASLIAAMPPPSPAQAAGQPWQPRPQPQDPTLAIHRQIQQDVPYYLAYSAAALGFGLVLDILLLVSGVGLLNMWGWSRPASLVYACLSLLHKLLCAVYLGAIYFPTANAIIEQQAQRPGTVPGFAFGFKLGAFGRAALPLLFTPYPILVLILLSLPSVAAAFRAPVEPPDSGELGGNHDEEYLADPDDHYR
jgi:hypothetical protein